ncbi:MAG: response regulator [Spirochaetes bacterium]|nr:response regulator [Spirochaetota bacterium]MBX3720311.1 response regulator [Turneriella sp.]
MSDKKKVLIVDDSGYMRQVIRRHLESKGFEVTGEASDGSEVVALAENLRPDLITMDLSMKTLGGIEATKQVKKAVPEAKVIVVSALGESRFIKEAVAAGAHDFIIKPFTEDRLISSVRSALKMN